MSMSVSEFAVIRNLANIIRDQTTSRDKRLGIVPQLQIVTLNQGIDDQYQKLFAMLPVGADKDQPLLDFLLSPDTVFWANVNRDCITSDDVDQWCYEYKQGKSDVSDIAKLRLLFFFGSAAALDIYLTKYVA
jgi:hypothetical protein